LERKDLIGKIVKIAGDYRKGEIVPFDEHHVQKWVAQFPVSVDYQDVILGEVGHMLENFYISRDCAKSNLTRLLKSMKKENFGGCSIADVNFLRTQDLGKSQHEILLIADEILQEAKGISTQNCGGSNVYLYLDDCMYSGNKWRYDIKDSTQLAEAKNGMILVSYHFAIYNGGYNYAKTFVQGCLSKKGGILKPFSTEMYNSERFGNENLDIMWPSYVKGDECVDEYANRVRSFCENKGWGMRPLFRTNQLASPGVFTSPKKRYIVEQAFLAAGAKMFCAAQNPAPSMRPMGFEVIATIGFGTPIVTWRNIPNNAPLALWYGDPAYGPNHPLGMWYPLFPRKM